MSGQAEDKETGPDTTVKDSSELNSKVTTPDTKEESHSNSKVVTPDTKEESHPTSKGVTLDAKDKSHATPEKSSSHQADEQEPPSRHLWVGNVSTSVTEAELAEQFSRFGDIDSVTAYPSRNYAFINFKTVEDGLYAKKGLQGTVLGGLAIRIEFAKGAKPSKHLWIGNISNSVTKEQLEAECKKFGVVDDVRILRDRNCAFVDFSKTDEAVAAFENLNKKIFGKDELCVEYVKSQLHPKKDSKSDDQPRGDERTSLQGEESASTFSVNTITEKPKRDRDEPSEILWVGFPICMKIDERKLHKAFSPFGGIERITTFPGRTYAFVQFHSVKAATRAKNVLQGKLFNDPRVSISFAKSEIGPVDNHARAAGSWVPSSPSANANMPPLLFSKPAGFANPRNDRFLNYNTFRPHSPSFRRRPEGDMDEAGMFFPNSHHEAGFRDDMARGIRPGPDLNTWGSPALPEGAFIHPRHAPHMQERWNFDVEALERRDSKRPRAAGNHSARGGLVELRSPDARDDREAFQVVKAQDYISKVTRMNNSDAMSMDSWEGLEGLKRPAKRPTIGLEMDVSRPSKDNWGPSGMPLSHFEGLQWQGVIAKSGTPVCRARCYPIGKATNFTFPEVVNCTARTSLDMLAKHISEVGDFSLVSFIPHGDLDVEAYQDFIVYLSEKNRAAVCKLSQESTLFLVPPSNFVEHFLKVPNEKNIIGVLLKLQQAFPSSAEQTGFVQPMKTEGTLAVSVLPAEGYRNSSSQAPAEHKPPIAAPIQAAFHGMPSTDMIASQLLLPSRPSLQSSSVVPNYAAAVGVSSTGSSVRPNNPSGLIDDDRSAHDHMQLPPGYASMQHQQHSTPQMGSFSLAPPGDLHSHQEQGMRMNPQLASPSSIQASSAAGQYPTSQIHNSQLKMQQAQTLASTSPYPQQPPLPQYPHPSMQKQLMQSAHIPLSSVPPSHTDQFSITTTQLQPFPENVPPVVHPQHASGSHLHHPHPQQNIAPNLVPIKEPLSLTGTQASHAPAVMQKDDNRAQTTAVDAEQRELLRLAQQKLSEAKGESGEDNKRFQATLELAAALLQQLQQRAK